MDESALVRLHEQSARHQVADLEGRVAGFLLALREGATYDSPNYRWFDSRGGRFLYIDRAVVHGPDQGRGIATALYDDLVEFALRSDVVRLACELDVEPPNEASRRFHDRLGFREVGTQWVAEGAKRVSLRELDLGERLGSAGRTDQSGSVVPLGPVDRPSESARF